MAQSEPDARRPRAGWPRPPAAGTGVAEPGPRASQSAALPPAPPHAHSAEMLHPQCSCGRAAVTRSDRPPASEATTSLEASEGATGGGKPSLRSQQEKWGALQACLPHKGAYSPPPLQTVSVSVSEKVPRAGAEQLDGGSTGEGRKRLTAPWTPFPVGFSSEPNRTRGERSAPSREEAETLRRTAGVQRALRERATRQGP